MHRKCPRWSASCARTRPAHPASRYKLLQTATQPRREAPSNTTALEMLSALCQLHPPLVLTTSTCCCTDLPSSSTAGGQQPTNS